VDDIDFCRYSACEFVDFSAELYGEEFGCELQALLGWYGGGE
jgi:hypothetical protein